MPIKTTIFKSYFLLQHTTALFLGLSPFLVSPSLVAAVDFWDMGKAKVYQQTSEGVMPSSPDRFAIWSFIEIENSTDANSATISKNGSIVTFNLSKDGNVFELNKEYATLGAMDAEFPDNATYTLELSGGTLGTITQQVIIGTANYPEAPTLEDKELARSRSVDSSQNHTFYWKAPSAIPSSIYLEIDDFENEFPGSQTSGDILADSVSPNGAYNGFLAFDNKTDVSGVGGFGVNGTIAHTSATELKVSTVSTLTPQSIVGAWQMGDGAPNNSEVFVFTAGGRYYHAIDDTGNDGMEYGTYISSGNHSPLNVTVIENMDGDSGLSAPSGSFTVAVDGDTLTINDADESHAFTRVKFKAGTANILEGAWELCDDSGANLSVLVFLSNGIYFQIEGAVDIGMERGTYTLNGLGALTTTQGVDTNGDAGLSDTGSLVAQSLGGRVLQVTENGTDNFTLHRISNARLFDDWGIHKGYEYRQTADNVQPTTPHRRGFFAEINTQNSEDIGSVKISGGGIAGSIALIEDYPAEWFYDKIFANDTLMNAEFPDNTLYTITISGGALGTLVQKINIGSASYPAVPYFTGTTFTEMKSIDPSKYFQLTHGPLPVSGGPSYLSITSMLDDEGEEYLDKEGLSGSTDLSAGILPVDSDSYAYLEYSEVAESFTGHGGFGVKGSSYRTSYLSNVPMHTWSTSEILDAAFVAAGLGAGADPLATPHNDGVENMIKYAFKMNLSASDTNSMLPGGVFGLPKAEPANLNAQSVLRIEYVRRKGSGLIYTATSSTSLADGSFNPMTGTETVSDIDSEWERVIIHESYDPNSILRYFGRVEVKIP